MPDPTDLTEAIRTVASEPKQVTGDGQTVVNQDLPALIAADKHLQGQQALRHGPPFGMRFAQIVPPGGA